MQVLCVEGYKTKTISDHYLVCCVHVLLMHIDSCIV